MIVKIKFEDEELDVDVTPGEYVMKFTVIQNGDDDFLAGELKWDGCMNFDGAGTMIHLCDPEGALRIAAIIKELYALGDEHIEHWSM
mgnify:CR=1 FL=1